MNEDEENDWLIAKEKWAKDLKKKKEEGHNPYYDHTPMDYPEDKGPPIKSTFTEMIDEI